MMREQLLYLSGPARAIVMAIVAVVFSCSLGLVAYLLWIHPTGNENIVVASISLANTAATAIGFLVVLLMSRVSVDVEGLKKSTDRFMLEELPDAFKAVDYGVPPIGTAEAPSIQSASNVKTAFSYVRGTSMARYEVEAFGMVQHVTVMLNVRRIVVAYAFPPTYRIEDQEIRQAFEYAEKGAQHAGYQTEWRMMGSGEQRHLEFRALVNLPQDFLTHSAERLFWSNDMAIMTRSVLKSRETYESGPLVTDAEPSGRDGQTEGPME
ncbi:MAG TPA: hypothetical protein DIT93_00100 [Pelagibacterium sp.]|uniref:hypothetical protein n=1 Tax=uncultured Pelagibacterium sp. TaxID=1159875 RepID=UPI000C4E95CC|nr:hypothetical protein [Pelagibacterium sp.]HCO53403.1 hypothetical protein [Pelagibacterium sp.]|tara:strand:+ start:3743 stop:4540 length:798 start_codon:yes stop_codon:yes gene_type:complete